VIVRRAKALPLVHPQFRGTAVPGVVTIVVVPENDDPNSDTCGDHTRDRLRPPQHARLLTSEVYVTPPVLPADQSGS